MVWGTKWHKCIQEDFGRQKKNIMVPCLTAEIILNVQTGETETERLMRPESPAAILMDKHDDILEQVEELMEC